MSRYIIRSDLSHGTGHEQNMPVSTEQLNKICRTLMTQDSSTEEKDFTGTKCDFEIHGNVTWKRY
jgi:hypothetical protein